MASGSVPATGMFDLPDEILLEIFSYLPLDDMVRSSHVCKKWHSLLKRDKELWRRKEWSSNSVGATRELLKAGGGIPRLKCLQLLYGGEYGIRVTWPEVTVRLYVGTPFLWEPYFRSFDTESLVVSQLVAENVSGYMECVDTQTLRRICIAEQQLEYRQSQIGPYFTYVPTSPHYSSPVRTYECATMLHSTDQCYRQDCFSSDSSTASDESVSRRPSVVDTSELEDGFVVDNSVVCPSLEVLNVHCKRLSQQRLLELCGLGPLRVLRIECRGLRDLSLLRGCGPLLEELVVADCGSVEVEDFSELRGLTALRELRLSRCRLEVSALRDLTADLRHLRKLSLNGQDIK